MAGKKGASSQKMEAHGTFVNDQIVRRKATTPGSGTMTGEQLEWKKMQDGGARRQLVRDEGARRQLVRVLIDNLGRLHASFQLVRVLVDNFGRLHASFQDVDRALNIKEVHTILDFHGIKPHNPALVNEVRSILDFHIKPHNPALVNKVCAFLAKRGVDGKGGSSGVLEAKAFNQANLYAFAQRGVDGKGGSSGVLEAKAFNQANLYAFAQRGVDGKGGSSGVLEAKAFNQANLYAFAQVLGVSAHAEKKAVLGVSAHAEKKAVVWNPVAGGCKKPKIERMPARYRNDIIALREKLHQRFQATVNQRLLFAKGSAQWFRFLDRDKRGSLGKDHLRRSIRALNVEMAQVCPF
ncbi:hypothetical protein T484DRAFT_1760762 [Baffinella frigidus]|nr:hypothetical protein T484DRAFT_1760762 [Cryptophyta sp. CCMP2293]